MNSITITTDHHQPSRSSNSERCSCRKVSKAMMQLIVCVAIVYTASVLTIEETTSPISLSSSSGTTTGKKKINNKNSKRGSNNNNSTSASANDNLQPRPWILNLRIQKTGSSTMETFLKRWLEYHRLHQPLLPTQSSSQPSRSNNNNGGFSWYGFFCVNVYRVF